MTLSTRSSKYADKQSVVANKAGHDEENDEKTPGNYVDSLPLLEHISKFQLGLVQPHKMSEY